MVFVYHFGWLRFRTGRKLWRDSIFAKVAIYGTEPWLSYWPEGVCTFVYFGFAINIWELCNMLILKDTSENIHKVLPAAIFHRLNQYMLWMHVTLHAGGNKIFIKGKLRKKTAKQIFYLLVLWVSSNMIFLQPFIVIEQTCIYPASLWQTLRPFGRHFKIIWNWNEY